MIQSDTCKHSKAVFCAYEESNGYKCCVQELIHRRFGGLTGARICRGDDGYKQLQPEMIILENLSLTLFLEPVARLPEWASLDESKQNFLRMPHIYEIPFPWPFPK